MEDNIYTKINRKKRVKKGTIPFFMAYTGMCDKNHKMFNHANDIKPITPSGEPEPTPAETSSEVSGEASGGEATGVGVGESLKNINHLNEMAYSRGDAIEFCHNLAKQFIVHFDKVCNDTDINTRKHHIQEMQTWYNTIKDIKLKHNNKKLNNQQIMDWFLTSGSSTEDLFDNQTIAELYDKMIPYLLISDSVESAIKRINLPNVTEYDDEISDYFKVNDHTSDQNIHEDIDNNLNDLVSFIQKIDFDSVNDDISKEFGDWELEVWKDIVSWNSWWKSECLFIQIDNDKLNKHLHYGDIENQDELDYKKEKLLKRLLNQNNN